MYKGAERIPTAEVFVKELQDKNIPFLFVTNNATKTATEVKENLLHNFQIDVTEDHIYTSAMAALDHLNELNIGKKVLVVGEPSLKQEVQAAGFEMVDENPDFVLQALDRGVTYQQLEAACLAIQKGAKFVATNPDTNLPTERGFIPGAGALTAFLKACTQKEPLIIGKPYPDHHGRCHQKDATEEGRCRHGRGQLQYGYPGGRPLWCGHVDGPDRILPTGGH